jgi:hypothetical protein
MKTHGLLLLLLGLAAAAGCASGADMSGAGGGSGSGKQDASSSRSGGSTGAGGMSGGGGMVVNVDASVRADGSVPISLSPDAITFNWDTLSCNGCQAGGTGGTTVTSSGGATGRGGSGSGGSVSSSGGAGPGGSAGAGRGGATSAGSGGFVSTGGASSMGGRSSSGGTTGAGGSTSIGGATGAGGSGMDAGMPPRDASSTDIPPAAVDGAASTDAYTMRDTVGVPDLASDQRGPDTVPRCVTQIRSLIPMTDDLSRILVAGKGRQVVLRAEVLVGGSGASVWTWQGSWQGADGSKGQVSALPGAKDPAAAAFYVENAGTYTFTVSDGVGCAATLTVPATAGCSGCDDTVIIRSVPPPGVNIPVQTGAWTFTGAAPFYLEFMLSDGWPVSIAPRIGSNLVQAYVRINTTEGELAADGVADPRAAFAAVLREMNGPALQSYDVLVVPLDGESGSSIAATAPQLFPSLAPRNMIDFPIGGGVSVVGATRLSGAVVADARVILTNQNPAASANGNPLIFSSVGRSHADGNFVLYAQPGQYWVSVSPPAGSGLAEASTRDPITLLGDANLSFEWASISMAPLVINVTDASGTLVDGARVRLTSAETTTVGTLTVIGAGGTATQSAAGNVRTETTTAGGTARFPSLPAGATYHVLIAPPALGPWAATTVTTVDVPAGGATRTVQLLRQGSIAGKLEPGAGVTAPADWSQVNLVAYDRSADGPEAPQTVGANPDGTFTFGVSPGRPYVVMVVPGTGTGLARTFVGPGLLQASEFVLTQRVPRTRLCTGRVTDRKNVGLEGTALQVYCGQDWPGCVDPTMPLAETTAGFDGAYQLALPDPATR